MSYQRKRVNQEARAEQPGAPVAGPRPRPRKRDATDVAWPRNLAHAFVFNRPERDYDEDETTIFEREQELGDSDIMSDEHALAIEGSLARSIAPRGSSWRRRSLWALSSLGLLAAIAVWSSDWRDWASPSERTPTLRAIPLAHGEPVAQAPKPAPIAVAAPTPTAFESQPAAISGTLAESALATPEPEPEIDTKSKRHGRHHAVSAHKTKSHAKASRTKHGAIARRIEPLPEPSEAEEAGEATAAAANQGTLQINSRPWSRIVVDGSFVGHTPQRALHLAAGKHHVQLVNDEMDMSKALDVTIAAGQTVKRIETLDDNTSPN